MSRDPVGNGLMDDPQMAGDAAQVHPIHVQADGLLTHALRIALFFGLRRVFVLAKLALVALASGFSAPSFDLTGGAVAVRTSIHQSILTLSSLLATPRA